MRPQGDIKPSFGQVWSYGGGSRVMLVHRGKDRNMGEWIAVWLREFNPLSDMSIPWCGLYDDPEQRIAGWELIDEKEE